MGIEHKSGGFKGEFQSKKNHQFTLPLVANFQTVVLQIR